MKIFRYSVCLHRLEIHQLELLRYWRNNRYISRYMEYQEFITEDMQKVWFKKIDNINNFFFIIEYNKSAIGLINTADIDYNKKTADTGLFVWEEQYLNSHIPTLASLAMLDIFFKLFGIETVKAKVKNDNYKAIAYNEALGFELSEVNQKSGFDKYILHANRYFKDNKQLRKTAISLYKNNTDIYLKENDNISKEFLNILKGTSDEYQQELNLLLHYY